jgi:hypothetical protein
MMIFRAILLSVLFVSAQEENKIGAVVASSQGFRPLHSIDVSPMTAAIARLRGYIPLDASTRLLPLEESSSISTFKAEEEDASYIIDMDRGLRRMKKKNRNKAGKKMKKNKKSSSSSSSSSSKKKKKKKNAGKNGKR